MKKVLVVLAMGAFFAACNNASESTEAKVDPATSTVEAVVDTAKSAVDTAAAKVDSLKK